MLSKDFHERFSIKISKSEGEQKFISRVEVLIFDPIDKEEVFFFGPCFLRWISKELGERWDKYISSGHHDEYVVSTFNIKDVYRANFTRCLQLLELIYEYAKNHYTRYNKDGAHIATHLDKHIPDILNKSEIDMGILWKGGRFYPAGVKLLDEKLVEDVLDWLNKFPDEKKDFDKALKALMRKDPNEAVANCYKCSEGFVRNFLSNNKTLENNKEILLSKLGLSTYWGTILGCYMNYANEYGKHGSKLRHSVDNNEAEGFIYLTGLIIRLCISTEDKLKSGVIGDGPERAKPLLKI